MSDFTSIDRVARRFASRPGCRFVGSRAVGIAVYLMNLRVIAVEAKDINPVDEFLLRSLGYDIDTPEELSNFLGLDARTVENRLVELRRGELIEVIPALEGEPIRCKLTSRGRTIAATLRQAELQEITIPGVVFHGILRRPVIVPTEHLLRPKELRESEWSAIPHIPSRQPRPEEIGLEELGGVIRNQWQRRRKGKAPDLITVRSILKDVRTMYLPAVLIQYELTGKRKQQQVAFAIDGHIDEELETKFAECKGPERIPELLAERFSSTADLAAEFVQPHIVKRLGQLNDVDELVEKLEVADAKLEQITSANEVVDRPDTKQMLRAELEQIRTEKASLEQKLSQRKARRLRVFDCKHILKTTLAGAKERIVIVSAFLSSNVVNEEFKRDLEGALKRNVKVWIAYGMSSQGKRDAERERERDWKDAEVRFRELQKRYPQGFQFLDLGNTHEKILIRDRDFVVSGSFNWLSFQGDPRRPRRFEDALLVNEAEAVEEYFTEIIGRFDKANKK